MPMTLQRMRPWLDIYPDREKAPFLSNGFSYGFLLPSCAGPGCEVVPNLKSVVSFPQIVREKIFKKISEDQVAGPFRNFRISLLQHFPESKTYLDFLGWLQYKP